MSEKSKSEKISFSDPYLERNHELNSRLPQAGFLRLKQILGDPKAAPPIPPIFPVSKSTWWDGINEGRYPRPVRLSARSVGWRVEDILVLIEKIEKGVV